MRFNKFFRTQNCPYCKGNFPAIMKINKKLIPKSKLKINDITNEHNFNVNFHPIIKKIKYKNDDEEFSTPLITIGKIKGGIIKESFSIRGGYNKNLISAFFNGYFNDEMSEDYQGEYERYLKRKWIELNDKIK